MPDQETIMNNISRGGFVKTALGGVVATSAMNFGAFRSRRYAGKKLQEHSYQSRINHT